MRRARAFVVRFVLGAVAIWAAYVVLINLLLVTGLAKRMLNHLSPRVAVSWSSAHSDWFARFHVHDLVIRGDDAGAQWRITIDDGRTSVDPYELFQKKVHLYDVRGRGVTVRVRRKVEPREATPDYLAKLPPIPGLPEPLKPAVKPPPGGKHVVLEMTNIVAEDVREVWVDTVLVDDAGARAEGGFFFDPGHMVRVNAAVHARSGGITVGKEPVVERTRGVFGLVIRDLDPNAPGAAAHFDVEAHAIGEMGGATWLEPLLAKHGVALHGGTGPVEAWVEISRGVVQPKSRADARAEDWTVRASEYVFSGSTLAHAVVRSQVTILTESYGVDVRHRDAKIAHAPRVSTSVLFAKRDLGVRFGEWSLATDVPGARFDDVRALNGYFGKRVMLRGSALAGLHAKLDAERVSGSTKLDCEQVSFILGKAIVTGDGTATATLREFDFATGRGAFSLARAEVHDVAVGDQRGWWARVTAAPLVIAASREHTASKLTGEMRDARTPLEILGAPRFANWLVGDDKLVASSQLRTMGSSFSFDDVRIVGEHLEVTGNVAKAPDRGPDGSFFASLPLLGIRFTIDDGKVSTHPFASRNKS